MREKTDKNITDLQNAAEKEQAIDEKLDEIIALLAQNKFDNETIKHLQQKFNDAIEGKDYNRKELEAFKVIDEIDNASREELLEEFTMLLTSNKVDSKFSSKYLRAERTNRVILMLIGIVMTALGFAMIIMPAPPYFEMYVIYAYNEDNGITLMDLISLIIVFSGTYLFIRSLYKKPLSQ